MNTSYKHIKVCHFASVHGIGDTRVFHRECVSLAKYFDITYIGIGDFTGVRDGVTIIGIPRPKSRLQRILHTARKAYKIAVNQHADIYHFHDPELIPYALLLKWKGKKVVYDIHENVTESMKMKKWLPLKWIFIGLYLLFDRLAANNFELILAEDAYISVYKKRYPAKETHLLQNFAPLTLLKEFSVTDRASLGEDIFYMGSIDELYCYRQMLEATYLLKQKGWAGNLFIVGWMSKSTQASIINLPFYNDIKDRLCFKGYMKIEEGYALSMQCALGFCFVSNNINTRDSLPRKLFEYMSVGLPVISSDFPSYKKLITKLEIGECVNSMNPEDIAGITWKLLHNKSLLNKYASNNSKVANKTYNWESQEKALVDLYIQLVG